MARGSATVTALPKSMSQRSCGADISVISREAEHTNGCSLASVFTAASNSQQTVGRGDCQGSGRVSTGFVGMYGTERVAAVQGRLREVAGQVD